MGDDSAEILSGPASAFGWIRRSEIGPAVWEKPDGTLHTHFSTAEPILHRRRSPTFRSHQEKPRES